MEGSGPGGATSSLFSFVQHLMDRQDTSSSSPRSIMGLSSALSPEPVVASSAPPPADHTPQPPEDCSPEATEDGSNGGARIDTSDDDAAAPTLLQKQQQRAEAQTLKYLKSEEYRQLFRLPAEEMLIGDFNCALQKKILLQGHMYLFDHYVCFYSNIFGYEKKKVIPLKDVTCVRKARTAGVFPNAIEILAWGKKVSMRASLGELGRGTEKEGDNAPGPQPKGHFFASFLSRDEAFRLIIDGWVQHSSYAKLFWNSQESLASLAASPQSRSYTGENGGLTQSVWQSPLLVTRLEAGANYESRVEELAANLMAPDNKTTPVLQEQGEVESSVEDDGTTTHTSSFCEQLVPIWEVEELDTPSMPDSYKTVVESEFPVDVEKFFQLFFLDEGFAKDFHTKCGDDDFRCTLWAKHHHFGHARDISFRHPINFYFGPKFTYCHQSQRFRVYRNSHLVLETSQQMTDIPYGDYFRVEVRWDVERIYGRGQCYCSVRVSLDVFFLKKTVWRSKIEQGTFDESKEAYTTWIRLAEEVLRGMKALVTDHHDGRDSPTTGIQELEDVSARSLDSNDDTGQQRLAVDSEEVVERSEEVQHAKGQSNDVPEMGEVSTAPTKNTARASLQAQAKGPSPGQSQWARAVRAVSNDAYLTFQRLWQKGSAFNFKGGGQFMLMLVAAIIILMQIGIIITLAWPSKVQLVPGGSQGSCFGVSRDDETLAWLEKRARCVTEEIAMADIRLQTLHQDIAMLKAYADQFQKLLRSSSDS